MLVTLLCLTLCDLVDCYLLGSSVHGILQARILEWVVILFSRGTSWPRDQTQDSCIVGRFFIIWATRGNRVALTGNSEERSVQALEKEIPGLARGAERGSWEVESHPFPNLLFNGGDLWQCLATCFRSFSWLGEEVTRVPEQLCSAQCTVHRAVAFFLPPCLPPASTLFPSVFPLVFNKYSA